MNPEAPPSIPSETPIVGYCRACGKALDSANVRTAHGTIYCAEHVPAEPVSAAHGLTESQSPRQDAMQDASQHGDKAGRDDGEPGGAEIERARLHKGDGDARGPANPEDRAEQRHREGHH